MPFSLCCNRAIVALGFVCFVLITPCQAGPETVISSVADCSSVGGLGFWSNPANWSPMQVPDNGRPHGTTYDVVASSVTCTGMYLDASVTVNQINMRAGFWDGAKKKAPKVAANGVALTVLKDCWIDELGLTNGRLDVGGTTLLSNNGGWILKDSTIRTQNYRESGYQQARFGRSILDVTNTFAISEWAWAELRESTLKTHDLELLNGSLSLLDGAAVRVTGDLRIEAPGGLAGLGFQLDGHADLMVDGNVLLSGSLSGWLSDEYVPSVGDEFPILRYKGSLIGDWVALNLPQLPEGRGWSVVIVGKTVYLKVIPTR